ncbi:MAG: DNA-binding protein [Deltaproteobacteria bacterium]|nr:MAG: DNA-binding protein [Deltaproteobacteria bacterium]
MGKKKKSVYIETSIVSYYVARPTRDIIVLAHQQLTREWWDGVAEHYRSFISEIVLDEAGRGNRFAARRRLEALAGFQRLAMTAAVEKLTTTYMKKLHLPKGALRDAAHLAMTVAHEIDYLLTWNCRHLANGEIIRKVWDINKAAGLHIPVICTPVELVGGDANVS